ncbi:MAG: S1/P1 Nuclease [Rhizobacter sp.]|nr:S1/P1 Nuclease [Chlorobiales bacterium]
MKHIAAFFLAATVLLLPLHFAQGWGFWAHKQIHRQAVYLMPAPLAPFFRANEKFLIDHSVDPDDRRRVDPTEAPQHFIDLDRYGKYPFATLPHNYDDAVKKFSDSTVKSNGLVPWRIAGFAAKLTQAFKEKNRSDILYYAANVGHYIADCNVPLHATENYDGQLTGQKGIHGRWESEIPERYMKGYEQMYSNASVYYIADKTEESFRWALESFSLTDSVLACDRNARAGLQPEEVMTKTTDSKGRERETFTPKYYENYKRELGNMVERRFEQSSLRVASIWYSAWVDAGMPDISGL